jgi:hypothetical protein
MPLQVMQSSVVSLRFLLCCWVCGVGPRLSIIVNSIPIDHPDIRRDEQLDAVAVIVVCGCRRKDRREPGE